MPRPIKWRKVCCLPDCDEFGPLNKTLQRDQFVIMSIDEYETIRLIDLEGYTQEECSKQMNIARTTVQGIYNEARKKIADSLVNSKALLIKGGEYNLCDGHGGLCGKAGCRKYRNNCENNIESSDS